MALIVSVVIPAYRRTTLLRKAVLSLFKQDFPRDQYEIIVVDSSPDDANERLLRELSESSPCPLRWFRKQPEGPGPSRNLGAARARGDLIAFLDSDCCAAPGWLRAGVAAFGEGVGLVQGRTLPDPGEPLGIFRYYVRVERESFLYETANIFYRRAAFEGSGGFPPDLRPHARRHMGGEDVIVAWIVRRNGWKTAFAAEALVYHEVMPLSLWGWIFIPQMFIWPALVRRVPELRRFMVGGYFLDTPQALLVLGMAGMLGGALLSPAWLALFLPYALYRAAQPTASLGGLLRPARVLAYLTRDVATLSFLLAGSVRYRCLLL